MATAVWGILLATRTRAITEGSVRSLSFVACYTRGETIVGAVAFNASRGLLDYADLIGQRPAGQGVAAAPGRPATIPQRPPAHPDPAYAWTSTALAPWAPPAAASWAPPAVAPWGAPA